MMRGEEGSVRLAVPLGFAVSVAMWAVGYVGRFPGVGAPPALLGILFLLLYLACGVLARAFGAKLREAATAGFLVSLINVLILGSLLGEGGKLALAIPGALVAGAALASLGFAAAFVLKGKLALAGEELFALVVVAATFLLVVAGGLVTSQGAGLAVPDWPNTFGTNMFLFPLARMTGGVYYEHAHRLFGSLVGLATLSLALYVTFSPRPRPLKLWGWGLFLLVSLQGLLGGLRVTGRLTTSQDPSVLSPSLTLAAVHGVLGQLFLSSVVAFALVLSRSWQNRRQDGPTSRWPGVLWGLLVVQLVLGALQRHFAQGLLIHITLATVILVLAVVGGVGLSLRSWPGPGRRLGQGLVGVACAQVILGFAALWLRGYPPGPRAQSPWEVLLATSHQAGGALLLALATAVWVWSWGSRVRS
jgi:cytochrome c oxidase assembly protein subunit 15